MPEMKRTRFHDRFDLDLALRDASLDGTVRPTRRMIAAASLGKEVNDAYYATRELREAVASVHDGLEAGKPRLAAILGNTGPDDYQRCLYYSLAGRGVGAMLDDLAWLERLLEARGRLSGKLREAKVRPKPLVDPYVSPEPDGPVGAIAPDFAQGPSWWLDPTLDG